MDRNRSEQAQYAWISVIERGVYRKKPQLRTWEFYMKLGNTLRPINLPRAAGMSVEPVRNYEAFRLVSEENKADEQRVCSTMFSSLPTVRCMDMASSIRSRLRAHL